MDYNLLVYVFAFVGVLHVAKYALFELGEFVRWVRHWRATL
jgi:hypothetical protein